MNSNKAQEDNNSLQVYENEVVEPEIVENISGQNYNRHEETIPKPSFSFKKFGIGFPIIASAILTITVLFGAFILFILLGIIMLPIILISIAFGRHRVIVKKFNFRSDKNKHYPSE